MSDTAGSRRDGPVDQLLLEADLDGDTQLRPVLLELRALGAVAPEPTAELLALMAGANGTLAAVEPSAGPADELAARRRAKRRATLTALSVAVSLSAGGAVAAASDQGIRESFGQLNRVATSFITGSGGAPVDDQAEQPAAPLPAAPAGTAPAGAPTVGDPTSIPADPAAATQPTAGPQSDGPGERPATRQPTSPGKPGEVPASETLPGVVPGHIADGLGGSPEVPVPSQVPLPATLPAVPLP